MEAHNLSMVVKTWDISLRMPSRKRTRSSGTRVVQQRVYLIQEHVRGHAVLLDLSNFSNGECKWCLWLKLMIMSKMKEAEGIIVTVSKHESNC